MSERSEPAPQELRRIPPPEGFRSRARLASLEAFERLYRQSLEDPETFWGETAAELHWFERWTQVRAWEEPHARWFVGGTTNLAYNCLDLQVERGRGGKVALYWEGEPGDRRTITYRELLGEVERFANVLKQRGVTRGERVVIYLPMIPEAVVAMLACARIGAPHAVVFAGFSAQALADRIRDAGATLVVTADGGYRRGTVVPLKPAVDEALAVCPSVTSVITVKRAGNDVAMQPQRDVWYHDAMEGAGDVCPAEPLDAEHPLFLLYTSGSGGKPKGVLHTTGGYQTFTYLTARTVFDLQDDDVYWCTADVGWVTGHSYVVYGPMSNGATQVMVEGAPTHPDPDRFWTIIERYGVSVFYTAPTAIRAFMKLGEAYPGRHDLRSLRLLGTVGEPIAPEAWMWYRRVIGGERCPVVDTWWQTETGGIMISTLPGVHDAKPGAAGVPMFGVDAAVVDVDGKEVPPGEGGYLVVRRPWPSMLRTVYGDDDLYRHQYWNEIPHAYFAGDGARRDAEGYFRIMGRVDDVVNHSGHRLGTMEVESALVSHPAVAEAAVVGRPDEVKGQAIVAFVTLEPGATASAELLEALRQHVADQIGAFARPDELRVAEALPRTRSGKIMRRLLRNVAAGKDPARDAAAPEERTMLDGLGSGRTADS